MTQSLSSAVAMLHGHQMHYVRAGHGPALVLLHGVLGSRQQWGRVINDLAEDHEVIAPDLFGHGDSAKPAGDYSLGAFAAALRDLLAELQVDRATLVGHSLGGGIAMQFAYLFPERVNSMILVSSGGLGPELSVLLRAATLPGVGLVLPAIVPPVRWGRDVVARGLRRLRLADPVLAALGTDPDLGEALHGFLTLGDNESRQAFLATMRSVANPRGQVVSANDRLYLMREVPTLIIWGGRDRIVPVAHAYEAQRRLPGSRLEVFPTAGHFPQLSDPERFVMTLREFMMTATPNGSPRLRLAGN